MLCYGLLSMMGIRTAYHWVLCCHGQQNRAPSKTAQIKTRQPCSVLVTCLSQVTNSQIGQIYLSIWILVWYQVGAAIHDGMLFWAPKRSNMVGCPQHYTWVMSLTLIGCWFREHIMIGSKPKSKINKQCISNQQTIVAFSTRIINTPYIDSIIVLVLTSYISFVLICKFNSTSISCMSSAKEIHTNKDYIHKQGLCLQSLKSLKKILGQ